MARYIEDFDEAETDNSGPSLKDYGLTESDVILYESGKKKYEEAMKREEERQGKERKIFATILIVGYILSFVPLCMDFAMEMKVILHFIIAIIILFISITKLNTGGIEVKRELYIKKELDEKYNSFINARELYLDCIEKSRKNYWINMTGYQFEAEVAWLYRQLGYTATVTPKSSDGGVDIILEKESECIAVQCKHHSSEVGPHDVRALKGVVADQAFESGIFVSLNGFTSTVYKEKRNGKVKIELVTLSDILRMVNDCATKTKPKIVMPETMIEPPENKKNIRTLTRKGVNLNKNIGHGVGKCVKVGSTVKIKVLEENEIEEYTIVEKNDNFEDEYISKTTDLGKALLGRRENEEIEVCVKEGSYHVRILNIQ